MNDKEFINNPDNWPMWPFLPVKRRNNSLQDKNLGFLCDGDKKLTVYHGYVFAKKEKLDSLPQTSYDSVDEMLADGWKVD